MINIREIQKKYGFSFKSSLGQNFFNNEILLEEILNILYIDKESTVLEIGPGFGVLTEKLLKICSHVICVEIDYNAYDILLNEFKGIKNLTLLNEDFLKMDLNNFKNIKGLKIIANIPYYITTPILEKLFSSDLDIDFIGVMVQKEVGNRILASPSTKEYGSLTVFSNYYSKCNLIKKIPACNFTPVPKVDSMFLKFSIIKEREFQGKLEKEFLSFVKKCFSMRRKTLFNVLSQFKLNKCELSKISQNINIDFNKRAETLSLDDFKKLFLSISKSN